MSNKDVTHLIERLEAFEDRLGVRLESIHSDLNVHDDSAWLRVRGELHPKSGTKLQEDLELVVAAYDSSSQVVGTTTSIFEASEFFGFEIFNILVEIHVDKLTRVRVYPKKW